MKELTTLLGIESVQTTPYHPQANGLVERMHATLESIIKKAHSEGKEWTS